MKYNVTITGIGPEALTFLGPEPDQSFVILFNEEAPPELAELAILHTEGKLLAPPVPGDILKLGKKIYDITAVGAEAVHTLSLLGHCTLVFDGAGTPSRPGCLHLKGEPVTPGDLPAGETIQIF